MVRARIACSATMGHQPRKTPGLPSAIPLLPTEVPLSTLILSTVTGLPALSPCPSGPLPLFSPELVVGLLHLVHLVLRVLQRTLQLVQVLLIPVGTQGTCTQAHSCQHARHTHTGRGGGGAEGGATNVLQWGGTQHRRRQVSKLLACICLVPCAWQKANTIKHPQLLSAESTKQMCPRGPVPPAYVLCVDGLPHRVGAVLALASLRLGLHRPGQGSQRDTRSALSTACVLTASYQCVSRCQEAMLLVSCVFMCKMRGE